MDIICDMLLMITTDHNFVLWFVKTKSKFAAIHLNVKYFVRFYKLKIVYRLNFNLIFP